MTTLTQDIEGKIVLVGISGPSSSGKTSVSQLLRKLFKDSILIHEDDYYRNDKDIPYDEEFKEQNWDCPEAIDFELFEKHLSSFKNDSNYQVTTHTIQSQYESILDPKLEEKLKDKIAKAIGDTNYRIVLIDGFLLYHESSKLFDILDVKIFIKASFDILKKRRGSREGYQTKDSFWVDPPGYFEKLVYPNYVKNHKHLFKNGDIERETQVLDNDTKYGIDLFNITDEKTSIQEILEWSVDTILLHCN